MLARDRALVEFVKRVSAICARQSVLHEYDDARSVHPDGLPAEEDAHGLVTVRAARRQPVNCSVQPCSCARLRAMIIAGTSTTPGMMRSDEIRSISPCRPYFFSHAIQSRSHRQSRDGRRAQSTPASSACLTPGEPSSSGSRKMLRRRSAFSSCPSRRSACRSRTCPTRLGERHRTRFAVRGEHRVHLARPELRTPLVRDRRKSIGVLHSVGPVVVRVKDLTCVFR